MVTNPVLVALDTPTAEEAVRLAKAVSADVGGFKVGLRLLLGPGPATVAAVADLGKPVFADAKLHDIPSQVEAAARRLGEFGARWVTAHAAGGPAMLEAAEAGLGSVGSGRVLAVTVMTSLTEADLIAAGVGSTPGKLSARMSKLAARAGCEGVICSPRELGVVGEVAPGLLRVTPGIRPAGPGDDDQARVATPVEALGWGADWLVIGRPITSAADPAAAAAAIWEEIRGRDPSD
jgi:orotidine-5'-phosphate decarboxylase